MFDNVNYPKSAFEILDFAHWTAPGYGEDHETHLQDRQGFTFSQDAIANLR